MSRVAILVCRKTASEDVWEVLNWFVNNDEKWIRKKKIPQDFLRRCRS
jgi:hypothetical protein